MKDEASWIALLAFAYTLEYRVYASRASRLNDAIVYHRLQNGTPCWQEHKTCEGIVFFLTVTGEL